MLNVLRVEEGKSLKFGLIKIHHKKLIRRREINFLTCELFVEVGHILAMFLEDQTEYESVEKRK